MRTFYQNVCRAIVLGTVVWLFWGSFVKADHGSHVFAGLKDGLKQSRSVAFLLLTGDDAVPWRGPDQVLQRLEWVTMMKSLASLVVGDLMDPNPEACQDPPTRTWASKCGEDRREELHCDFS